MVKEYLRVHPELTDLVRDMSAALVEEFRRERSEIDLVVNQDPETDDRQLTFYVRLPEYDDSLLPRLEAVPDQVDSRYSPTPEWILVTTDYHPVQ